MTLYRATVMDVSGNPFVHDSAEVLRADSDGAIVVEDGTIIARGAYLDLRAAHPGEPVEDLHGLFEPKFEWL